MLVSYLKLIFGIKYYISMRTLSFFLVVFCLLSCDPDICSDVNINNNLNVNLNLNFISKDKSFSDDVFIVDEKSDVSIESVCSFGPLVLDYTIYDSIYISDASNEILKVYKEDTPGKNIYNIDEYWTVSETSKNYFVYTYEITEEDLK
jgi:hypothetical protein